VSTRRDVDGNDIKQHSKDGLTHNERLGATANVVPGPTRPNASLGDSAHAELSRRRARSDKGYTTRIDTAERLDCRPGHACPSRRADGRRSPNVSVAERSATCRCFEDLFISERNRLFRALCEVLRDPSEAEEVEQETFVRVLERWDRVSAMADPTGYLYRVAMNVFRSRCRRARVAATVVFAETQTDEIARIDDRDLLIRTLATLTPRQRAAMILTHAFDYSSEEAGEILRIRASSIRVLTSRGRAAIRRAETKRGQG
jgi:RNA polymerase sigma-70 factor, ECF subfamily